MSSEYGRRDFLKMGAAVGSGLALGSMAVSGCANNSRVLTTKAKQLQAAPIEVVRVGVVGVGGRSISLIRPLLHIPNVEVKAVCDIEDWKIERAQDWVTKAGHPKPDGYCCGEWGFKKLCARDDLDLVVTATPWNWHVPVCVEAMKNGKHAATEVPAAVTIDGCWELVETSEKTQKHCVMLENTCYFREALMILNMVRKGLFGEMLHGEAGYQHYRINFCVLEKEGRLNWCGEHSRTRNGNLYPTHQMGPVAQWLNVNRGDRLDYMMSMSTKSRGMNIYAAEHELLGPDHPLAKMKYALGDINTTLIRTVNGCTITLYHDVQSPRPYDLIFRAQGTKGLAMGAQNQIYIHSRTPRNIGRGHTYEPMLETYSDEFEHPLWKAMESKAKKLGGHGGSDFLEMYRLVRALQTGTRTDYDVYDAADWSVISELSERSVANRGKTQDFPDFTRGAWKTREPLGIVEA